MRVMTVNIGVRPSLRRTCLNWFMKDSIGLPPILSVTVEQAHAMDDLGE
jgi:hypothetical protein